jgi:hypothetical protein
MATTAKAVRRPRPPGGRPKREGEHIRFIATPRQVDWIGNETARLGISRQELLRRILDDAVNRQESPAAVG